jgi:hypothetical protein
MKPCRSPTAVGPALPARMTMPSTSISVVARRTGVVLPSSVTSTSALGLLGSSATDPARAMVFEAAADDANIVRELRRGDRVAVACAALMRTVSRHSVAANPLRKMTRDLLTPC